MDLKWVCEVTQCMECGKTLRAYEISSKHSPSQKKGHRSIYEAIADLLDSNDSTRLTTSMIQFFSSAIHCSHLLLSNNLIPLD
jgi:hypothetical protein